MTLTKIRRKAETAVGEEGEGRQREKRIGRWGGRGHRGGGGRRRETGKGKDAHALSGAGIFHWALCWEPSPVLVGTECRQTEDSSSEVSGPLALSWYTNARHFYMYVLHKVCLKVL